jgi:hypothetical protein
MLNLMQFMKIIYIKYSFSYDKKMHYLLLHLYKVNNLIFTNGSLSLFSLHKRSFTTTDRILALRTIHEPDQVQYRVVVGTTNLEKACHSAFMILNQRP